MEFHGVRMSLLLNTADDQREERFHEDFARNRPLPGNPEIWRIHYS